MRFALDLYLIAIDIRIGRFWHLSMLATSLAGVHLTARCLYVHHGKRCTMIGRHGFGGLVCTMPSETIREAWDLLDA